MKVKVFSARRDERKVLIDVFADKEHELHFTEMRLDTESLPLVNGHDAVSIFVNDHLDANLIAQLAERGVRLIALRCAGYNNVDLEAAHNHGITVVRVPAYSPNAIAEHSLTLMLGLSRHLHRAYNRVRNGNFTLDGMLGQELYRKQVGIVGTGAIGRILAQILQGIGCTVKAYDLFPHPDCERMGIEYLPLEQLLAESDIVSLHCPLTPETHYMINRDSLSAMKPGAMLINTSRGALIDTAAVIEALKSGQLGALGIDVYEEEADLFFTDLSDQVIADDELMRLTTFPNVMITAHQAYFTREAITSIAQVTAENITAFEAGENCANAL